MRWQGLSADIGCHRAEVPCVSVGRPVSRGSLDFGFGLHTSFDAQDILISILF